MKSKAKVAGELVYFSLSVLYGRYTVYTSVYHKNRFTVHSIQKVEYTNLLHFTYWAVFTTTTMVRLASVIIAPVY